MFTKYLELSAGFSVEARDGLELKEMLSFLLEDQRVELFGVGNNDVLIDCIGPSVITMINDTWNTSYKSLYKRKDLIEFSKEIKNHKILSIDSALSDDKKDLGKIFITNRGIKPGKGLGKDLPVVGDLGIKVVTGVYTPEFQKLSFNERNSLVFFGDDTEGIIKFIDDSDIFDLIVAVTAAIEDFIIK